MNKLIYIDESGISSKIGHSVYVCLYVEFNHHQYISNKIIEVEKRLKISYTHWTEMPWKLRAKFAQMIKDLDFEVKAVVYKNPILPDVVFELALKTLLNKEENVIKISIDGKKDKSYKKYLKKLLRSYGLEVNNIKMVNDKNEPLIRLADFIAGLIRYNSDNSDNNKTGEIFKLLKSKIIELNQIAK
jgi:Protein of unknown function (DUF3800)